MTDYLTLVVLVIFIGAFIVKCWELIVAVLGVVKYFAVPLFIAAVLCYGPSLYRWLIR